MKSIIDHLELTKISSKGQLVIPQNIREKLKINEGNVFAITLQDNMIVLKKLNNPVEDEDIKTMKLVDEAWEDIENRRYRKISKENFLKELERW